MHEGWAPGTVRRKGAIVAMTDGGTSPSMSEVRLVGRLGAQVQDRVLPSGDEITVFSIVVDRAVRDVRGRTRIDTIACVATQSSVASRVRALEGGQLVEATGVLRRRFWRAGAGLGSAMEVDVRRIKRAKAS